MPSAGRRSACTFDALIQRNSRSHLVWGYAVPAALMIVAGLVGMKAGVAPQIQPLEKISKPLSAKAA